MFDDDEATGVDLGDTTVRQAWDAAMEHLRPYQDTITTVAVFVVMAALGLGALLLLWRWGRRQESRVVRRPAPEYLPGRVEVGQPVPLQTRHPRPGQRVTTYAACADQTVQLPSSWGRGPDADDDTHQIWL